MFPAVFRLVWCKTVCYTNDTMFRLPRSVKGGLRLLVPSVVFALVWVLGGRVAGAATGLSPLGGFLAGGSGRWTLLTLMAAVMFALCLLVPMFFCRYICPAGAVMRILPGRACRQMRGRSLGRFLFWAGVGGLLSRYPWTGFLDPLALCAGGLIVVPLVVNLVFKGWWCACACPLGAMQRLPLAPAKESFDRRAFLGVVLGAAGGAALRFVGKPGGKLRPPGAAAGNKFDGLCARCGACIRACPQKIIRQDRFLLPFVDFVRGGYCKKGCEVCSQVCAYGAIGKKAAIGKITNDQDSCRYSQSGGCGVCVGACPYKALKFGDDHIEIDLKLCTGCGYCVAECPYGSIEIPVPN